MEHMRDTHRKGTYTMPDDMRSRHLHSRKSSAGPCSTHAAFSLVFSSFSFKHLQ